MASKSSFLDKVLGRLPRLDKEGLQTVVERLAHERAFLETLFNTIEDGVLVGFSSRNTCCGFAWFTPATPEQVLVAIDQVIPFIELADLMVEAPPKLNGAAVTAINVGARLGVPGCDLQRREVGVAVGAEPDRAEHRAEPLQFGDLRVPEGDGPFPLAVVLHGGYWQSTYNLVAPEKGNQLDVVGWVTVNNQSGKVFESAAVKLMAGDVNKIAPKAAQATGVAMLDLLGPALAA